MAADTTHAKSPQVVGNMMAASMTSPTPSILTTVRRSPVVQLLR